MGPGSSPSSGTLGWHGGMVDLVAGIPVKDYAAALAWYQRLLGSPPSFEPTDTEAVWELAEHRSLYIEQRLDPGRLPACQP